MPPSKKPNIVGFISESASDELHLVLRGHLHLEALLNEIIERSVTNPQALGRLSQSFSNKVKILRAMDRLDEKTECLLLAINALRNKIAHQLHFNVTFDDAFSLVKTAAEAGVDFSDDTIYANRQLSEQWYGTNGVLTEVISNTFQELVWQNEHIFSKSEISSFLG